MGAFLPRHRLFILPAKDKGLLTAGSDDAIGELAIDLPEFIFDVFKTSRFQHRAGPSVAFILGGAIQRDSAGGRSGQLEGGPVFGRLMCLGDHLPFYIIKMIGVILYYLLQYDLGLIGKNPLSGKRSRHQHRSKGEK